MYLICRPLYGLSYSWWSGDGVLVGAWCTVTKGGGVGWGRDIDQNLPWHQPLPPPPSYPIRPPAAPFSLFLSLSFHPSRLLSLSPIPSPLFSFSCSLALPSLTHTFLPSSPPRYTRPSVAPAVLNPGSRMEKGFSAPRRESFGCCSQREAEDTFFVSRLCNTTDGVLF